MSPPFDVITRKPPVGSRIDWRNPITRGLVLAFPVNETGGRVIRDVVRGASATGTSIGLRNGVRAVYTDGMTETLLDAGMFDGQPVTVVVCIEETRTDGYGAVISITSGSGNPLDLGWSNSNTNIRYTSIFGSGGSLFQGTVATEKHAPHQYALAIGPDIVFAIDGQVVASRAGGNNGYIYPHYSTRGIQLGASPSGGATVGYIYHAFVWRRALSRAELQAVYADPYAMFQRPRRIIAYTPADSSSADATVEAGQAQSVEATATTALDATSATAGEGESVEADATASIAGTATAAQGQSVAADGTQSQSAAVEVAQGERVDADADLSIAASGSTAQSESVEADASQSIDATAEAAQGQGVEAEATTPGAITGEAAQGQSVEATATTSLDAIDARLAEGQHADADADLAIAATAAASEAESVTGSATQSQSAAGDASQAQSVSATATTEAPGEVHALVGVITGRSRYVGTISGRSRYVGVITARP